MKLNIVPARHGMQWVRAGLRAFARQPLAMTGLFFMFMTGLSLLAWLPLVGGLLALALVPAATLGLMVATQHIEAGRFPMPSCLIAGFRQGPKTTRAMLVLGALYAVAILGVMALSALADGGQFAQLYVEGGGLSQELMTQPGLRTAMWVSTLLYLPVSLAFWHAPALVYWHGVPPLKSLFFSLVAMLRNMPAFLVYGALWMLLSAGGGLILMVLTALTGNVAIASYGLLPMALVVATMFYTSLWFTYRDCFLDEGPPLTSGASA